MCEPTQRGANPPAVDTCHLRPEPRNEITYVSREPESLESKAIQRPLGEKQLPKPVATLSILNGSPPPTGMACTVQPPPAMSCADSTYFPSGDHPVEKLSPFPA